MRKTRHLGVLLRDALGGVDQNQADVGAVNGHVRSDDTVFFNVFLHSAPAAKPCGVDENIASIFIFKGGIHRVARGARHA